MPSAEIVATAVFEDFHDGCAINWSPRYARRGIDPPIATVPEATMREAAAVGAGGTGVGPDESPPPLHPITTYNAAKTAEREQCGISRPANNPLERFPAMVRRIFIVHCCRYN